MGVWGGPFHGAVILTHISHHSLAFRVNLANPVREELLAPLVLL